MSITITKTADGTVTVGIDVAAILALSTEHVIVPDTIAEIAPVEILAEIPAAPVKTKRAPRKSTKTAPAAPVATADETPAKRTSDENKALFRKIAAAKRAKRWDEATALAADAGWDGEVASIARKREAVAAG